MDAPPTHLRADSAAEILVRLGVAPAGVAVEVRPLVGGVSNSAFAAAWDGGRVVMKQSLARLQVADEWNFDRSRTLVERDCLAYLATVVPGHVPAVLACDTEAFVLVMTPAPDGEGWKEMLIGGRVDPAIAAQAGALLGRIHAVAATDAAVRRRFADPAPLIQGRVDPFHRTAAARNPELAAAIGAEVQRLLATRTTLVLGDFSPKNMIVTHDDGQLILFDFETAHWGDPSFDVAFLLTHLALKAQHMPDHGAALRAAAGAFVDAHRQAAGAVAPPDADVVAELGCLLLARVDGKSPAGYLTRVTRDRVRQLAREILLGGVTRLPAVLDLGFSFDEGGAG